MKISPDLFEAFLKCPTKCWLRASGEPDFGNPYAQWVRSQNESYRVTATQRLLSETPEDEAALSPPAENLKAAKWCLAASLVVKAQMNSCVLESEIHAVERVPSEGRGRPTQFIPIRFIFTNKLGKDDKLLLAFDALMLSEMLGREVSLGKIIHGDDHTTQKVKTSALAREVRKRIEKIATLLSSPSPPDLVLNRHCAECEFQTRCRQKAIEKDDLSLLAGMSAKERERHRSKGIFTIDQLSYTFRPRRTPKRTKNPAKPHHFALQALAIERTPFTSTARPNSRSARVRSIWTSKACLIVVPTISLGHSWSAMDRKRSTPSGRTRWPTRVPFSLNSRRPFLDYPTSASFTLATTTGWR